MQQRILLFFAFFFTLTFPAESNSSFTNYSTSEGLVHKTVNYIFRDSEGFLWVGTTNGLSRFDGNGFRNFSHSDARPLSIHGTLVDGIAEGRDGKLWLSTDRGLEYYDKKSETFHLIEIEPIKGTRFYRNLSVDERGNVWLYNNACQLIAYDPLANKIIARFDSRTCKEPFTISQFTIANSEVWIASDRGIAVYTPRTGAVRFIEKGNMTYCFSISKADRNTILITYMNEGIYVVDCQQKTGRWIKKKDIEQKLGIKTSFFSAMMDADSTVWIGISPGLVAVKNGTAKYYNHYSRSTYFEGDVVPVIFRDADNSLWFGTFEKGLFVKRQNTDFINFASRLYAGDLEKTIVTHLMVFDNGSMLYTDHQGMFYCPDYSKLTTNCAQLLYKESNAIIFPENGRYCLINCIDTMFEYDSYTRKMKRLVTSPGTSVAVKDRNGILWLGTWMGTICGYNIATGKKYTLEIDSANNNYVSIFSMIGDPDGSLWVGTFGAGLVHISNPTAEHPQYERFVKKANGENSISSNIIHSVRSDSKGNLWIATNGGGLNMLQKSTKTFTAYTTKDGLKSNIIESVIADNAGDIWFISNVLTHFNIAKQTFTHYSKSEGITGCFAANQCARSADGQLFFAGSTGILQVNPQKIPAKSKIEMPKLTNLRIRGVALCANDSIDGIVPYTESITYADKLELPYSLSSFSIEYVCTQFRDEQSIIYEYMLEDIDRTWIPSDRRNLMASYSGLRPGSYTFKVRASNDSEHWSEARILHIDIIPPWWLTWWFKLLITTILTAGAASIVANRFRRIRNQNLVLEQKVQERTEALTFANERLNENQMVIEMKNSELNEMLNSKNQLINVLGHDFKNPLSSILGSSTILKMEGASLHPDKMRKISESIYQSAATLIKQMSVLIDWAQSQNEDIVFVPAEINAEVLLDDAIALVRESAEQKAITITKQSEYESTIAVDPRMISIVIRNILGNAIKFTPRGGSVHLMIHEFDNEMELSCIDSGIGIGQDKLDQLFEPNRTFETSYGTENEKGTGLGLKICKTLVEKNKGRITVTSTEGKGSNFTIALPLGENKATHKTNSASQTVRKDEPAKHTHEANTILIIDDDAEILQLMEGVFGGYNTIKTLDGKEGLHFAQNVLPDIIISDIHLPSMNGYELCRELKDNPLTSHIPIILISSASNYDTADTAFESGANDFIAKPFNPYHLKHKVEGLLDYRLKLSEQQMHGSRTVFDNLPEDYNSKIIKKTIELVNSNLSDSSLDTLVVAERMGISRSQLWRIFKNATGKSLGDYIRDARMQKAAEMIKSGRYRISEVAYDVGFADPKYFTKCFAKEFGMNPSQYADKNTVK